MITLVRALGQYCTSHSTATSPESSDRMCSLLASMGGRAGHSAAQSLWGAAAPEGKIAAHGNLEGNLRRDGVSVRVCALKSEGREL